MKVMWLMEVWVWDGDDDSCEVIKEVIGFLILDCVFIWVGLVVGYFGGLILLNFDYWVDVLVDLIVKVVNVVVMIVVGEVGL